MNREHPPGPPMTLGNMREQGVHHLIAYFLNDSCRHSALIDVSNYGDHVEVPSFAADADAELERGGGDARRKRAQLGRSEWPACESSPQTRPPLPARCKTPSAAYHRKGRDRVREDWILAIQRPPTSAQFARSGFFFFIVSKSRTKSSSPAPCALFNSL